MDIIVKKIGIEELKNRHDSKHWFITNDGSIINNKPNWGMIPMDIIVDEKSELNDISNSLSFIYGLKKDSNKNDIKFDNKKNTIPYVTLLKWYHFLKEFARNCTFYRKCKYNGEERWSEEENISFFDFNDIEYFETFPLNDSGIEYGSLVGINVSAQTFNNIFRINNNNYEIPFIKLVNSVLDGKHDNISIPYINLPIHVNCDINSIGQYQVYAKIWNPKEEYRLGDIVIWFDENGIENTYILEKCDEYELVEIFGELYKTVEKNENGYYLIISFEYFQSDDFLELINNAKERIIVRKTDDSSVNRFFFPVGVHKSKYDEEKDEFIFDVIEGDNGHWRLLDNNEIIEPNTITSVEHEVTAKTESRITNVRRSKKSTDDDGNILPFIIDVYGNEDTELVFMIGPNSITIGDDGNIYSDVINSIKMEENNKNEGIEITYISGNTYNINKWYSLNSDDYAEETIKLTDNENSELKMYRKVYNTYNGVPIQTLYYSGITSTIVETKIDDNGNEFITNEISAINYIKTNFMRYSNPELINNKGIINFTYTLGSIVEYEKPDEINENNIIIYDKSGIKYTESYTFETQKTFINYVPSDMFVINNSRFNLIKINVDDIENYTVIDITDDKQALIDRNSIGVVYFNGTDYLRCLCEYNFFNINYESAKVNFGAYYNESKDNILMSNIKYSGQESINNGLFASPIYKDERFNDLENIRTDININIDRGSSSAFERLHILGEIKTFEDLENYRNNFFEI